MERLLEGLVGSRCRAAVLRVLTNGWAGTLSELARRVNFSVRSVGSEISALERAGLVNRESVGASDLVKLNRDSALAEPLRLLVEAARMPTQRHAETTELKETLAAMGAPLSGTSGVRHFSAEEAVVRALRLARTDGLVLRVLPLVLLRNQHTLDWTVLKERARREKVKAELGLVVSLAARLTGSVGLEEKVRDLRDRRRRRLRYLPEPRSAFERTLAEESSPAVAREWGFLMNASEESVRSFLNKHGALGA